MQIIDARCRPPIPHFLGDAMWANLEKTLANMRGRGYEPTPAILDKSVSLFLDSMHRSGIAKGVLPTRVPNESEGQELNDDAFQFRDAHPHRIAIAAAPATLLGPRAAEEAAALKARGAKAIVVEPGFVLDPPLYLDDAALAPLFDACVQLDLPVYATIGGAAGPDPTFNSPVPLDRLAVRFPKLQVVAVHGGWPYVQETLGTAFRRPNVWVMPDLYFPACSGEADYLVAIRGFLQDRFLFGTSFPLCPYEQVLARYESFGLPPAIFEKIMGANVARLLGI